MKMMFETELHDRFKKLWSVGGRFERRSCNQVFENFTFVSYLVGRSLYNQIVELTDAKVSGQLSDSED
ncbi:hypothetical protein C5167_047399 [Papaver somniferum]|uniref:Uncharacterized protein n=1 Tax=Papaver somniferum TaxID=3469 RepID=A0A4Y7LGI8_PAPSO|nr:hypothetical protein C5167_047399 [Papaver somniferum]